MHHNAYLDHKQNARLRTPLFHCHSRVRFPPSTTARTNITDTSFAHMDAPHSCSGPHMFVPCLYLFVRGDIGDTGRSVSSCERLRSADCCSAPFACAPFDCSAGRFPGSPLCMTTTVVFAGCAVPFVSGGVVSSSSSGIGEQYSLSTFLSCGLRIGLELGTK